MSSPNFAQRCSEAREAIGVDRLQKTKKHPQKTHLLHRHKAKAKEPREEEAQDRCLQLKKCWPVWTRMKTAKSPVMNSPWAIEEAAVPVVDKAKEPKDRNNLVDKIWELRTIL